MPLRLIFITEANKQYYAEAVLTWIQADFEARGRPLQHFWYNKNTIQEAFDSCTAMVAINEHNAVIGYLIWSLNNSEGVRAEIEIAEIQPSYRKQGIFKRMLTDLAAKLTNVAVFSAYPLPQAKKVFDALNWSTVFDASYNERRFQIIKPVAPQLDQLPPGRALAVLDPQTAARIDFWTVQANPAKYQQSMKYFPIILDENGKFATPIVTPYYHEGYIGIYFNGNLIAENKALHLFVDYYVDSGLLCIGSNTKLCNPECFPSDFFQTASDCELPEPPKKMPHRGATPPIPNPTLFTIGASGKKEVPETIQAPKPY